MHGSEEVGSLRFAWYVREIGENEDMDYVPIFGECVWTRGGWRMSKKQMLVVEQMDFCGIRLIL